MARADIHKYIICGIGLFALVVGAYVGVQSQQVDANAQEISANREKTHCLDRDKVDRKEHRSALDKVETRIITRVERSEDRIMSAIKDLKK